MDRLKTDTPLSLRPALYWSEAMSRDLAMIRDDPAGPQYYRQLFEMRDIGAYDVLRGTERVATALYRLDQTEFGREFVIVAAATADPSIGLADRLFEVLERQGAMLGARVTRLHTKRRGLIKKAGANGYAICEIVLRKFIGAGGEALH